MIEDGGTQPLEIIVIPSHSTRDQTPSVPYFRAHIGGGSEIDGTTPPSTSSHPVLTALPGATASPFDFTQPPPLDPHTLLPSYSHAQGTHGGRRYYDDDALRDEPPPSDLHQRLGQHYARDLENGVAPHVLSLLQQVQELFHQRIDAAIIQERQAGVSRLTGRVKATFLEKIDRRLHRHLLRSDIPSLAHLDQLEPRGAAQMLHWLSGGAPPPEGSRTVSQSIERFNKDLNRVSLSNEPRAHYRDDAKLRLLERIGAEYPDLLVEYTRLLRRSTENGDTHEVLNANVRELIDVFMQANGWSDPRTRTYPADAVHDRPRREWV